MADPTGVPAPEPTKERVAYLEAALREISLGRGAFSRDPLTHAENVIEDMKKVAVRTLAGTWKVPDND